MADNIVYISETLSYDLKKHQLFDKEEAIDLPNLEQGVLEYLIVNAGLLCSVDMILNNVWGYKADKLKGEDNTVAVHICNLRQKHPDLKKFIETKISQGYRLNIMKNEDYTFKADTEFYSDTTDSFTDEIEYIRKILNPSSDDAVNTFLSKEVFYGREWLDNEIEEWLAGSDPLLLIDAATGVGKSSYIAHSSSLHKNIAASIYCKSQSDLNNAESIIRLLIYKLCINYPEYRKRVFDILQDDDSSLLQINKTVQVLLIEPMSNMRKNGIRPVIVIDGLDEADIRDEDGHIYNPLADILSNTSFIDIKEYFRLIITCKTAPHIINRFTEYPRIHIDEKSENNLEDLKLFVSSELKDYISMLSPEDQAKGIELIAERSEGVFLYAGLVVKEISDGKRTINDQDIPKGLFNLYYDSFRRTFLGLGDDIYEQIYEAPIAILSAMEENVPTRTLKNACGWSRRNEQSFYRDFAYFVVKSEDGVRLFHKSLRDWLYTEEAGIYGLDKEDISEAKRMVTKGCYQSFEQSIDEMNNFEIYYLLNFLSDTGIWTKKYKKDRDIMLGAVLENKEFHEELIIRSRKALKDYDFVYAEKLLQTMECLSEKSENINAYIYLIKGRLSEHKGNLEDAKVYYEDGVNFLEDKKDAEIDSSVTVDIYSRYAFCLYRLTDYSGSVNVYEKLIDYTENSDDTTTEQLLDAKIDLARALRVEGCYEDALKIFEDINDIINEDPKSDYNTEFVSNPRLLYKKYLHEAWTYRNVKDNSKALELCKKADELFEGYSDAIVRNDLAMLKFNEAMINKDMHQFDSAFENMKQAIDIFSTIHGSESLEICDFIDALGDICQEQGMEYKAAGKRREAKEYFEKAENYYKKSYSIRRSHYDDTNYYLIYSLRRMIHIKILLRKDLEEIEEMIALEKTINQKRTVSDETVRKEEEKRIKRDEKMHNDSMSS